MNTVLAADGNYANITPSEDILTKYANVNMTCIHVNIIGIHLAGAKKHRYRIRRVTETEY